MVIGSVFIVDTGIAVTCIPVSILPEKAVRRYLYILLIVISGTCHADAGQNEITPCISRLEQAKLEGLQESSSSWTGIYADAAYRANPQPLISLAFNCAGEGNEACKSKVTREVQQALPDRNDLAFWIVGKPVGVEAELLIDGSKAVKKMFDSNQAISMYMKDLQQRGHDVDLKRVSQKYSYQNAYIAVQSEKPVREISGGIKNYAPDKNVDANDFMNRLVNDITVKGLEATSIDLGPEKPGVGPTITVRVTCANLPVTSPVIPMLSGRVRALK